jgi:hypothetical protein
MRISTAFTLTTALVMACLSSFATAAETTETTFKRNPVTGSAGDPNWREEWAYSLGVQAYAYTFPWYYNQLLLWKWTTQPPPHDRTPSMPLNSFWHSRYLTDASYTDGGSPNNDTLYSVAWLDLSQGPVVLSIPDTGDRYYSIVLMGFNGDNYDYIGKRNTGTKAGHYALIGPDWQGELPDNVKATRRSPNNTIFMLARTLISGEADKPAVHAIQDQYLLTPLSQFGQAQTSAVKYDTPWRPYPRKNDPLADWKTINRAMTQIPPTRDLNVVRQFATIGIGPNQDVDKVDDATKRGLVRALETGRDIVTSASYDRAVAGQSFVNGWTITPDLWGHIGDSGDYMARAVQSLRGITANNHEEAMYIVTTHAENGERYSGSDRFRLHFPAGKLPPVDAFWSLTPYNLQFNLIDNPINRHSIGDRSPKLQYDADGGLTLYIQKESPGTSKEGNWLPVSDGYFSLIMRCYLPRQVLIGKSWEPPALETIE